MTPGPAGPAPGLAGPTPDLAGPTSDPTGPTPDPTGATPDPALVARYAAARETVLERIASAAARAGRESSAITLVAVSKTVGPEDIVAAVAAGLTILGENRVQEAETKTGLVSGVAWHLIGPLQSNKARRAVTAFDLIESVDSVDLAERLDRIATELRPDRRLPVLLQVNVDGDPAKAGFEPSALDAALPKLLALGRLEIRGLMTVGRFVGDPEEARPTFVALRALSERLRGAGGAGDTHQSGIGPELSMGMTDDYPVAVEEGATIVRVGRAIFGERPAAAPGG